MGINLAESGLEVLGSARRVTVSKEDTIIVDGAGTSEAVAERREQIRREIERTDSTWDREKLEERLAKLSGGVAVIRVGAATETEVNERKLRVEDAINAARAAVEEGVIAGGGSALVQISQELETFAQEFDGEAKLVCCPWLGRLPVRLIGLLPMPVRMVPLLPPASRSCPMVKALTLRPWSTAT